MRLYHPRRIYGYGTQLYFGDDDHVWIGEPVNDVLDLHGDKGIWLMGGNVGINMTSPARRLHINDVMRLEPRATAPSSPSEGDIYMDSTDHKLKVYDGTTWQACW